MPIRKRIGKKRFVRKARKRTFRKRIDKSLVNTKYARIHHLPIAPRYFTTLECNCTGIATAMSTSGNMVFNIVPSSAQPFSLSHNPIGGTSLGAGYLVSLEDTSFNCDNFWYNGIQTLLGLYKNFRPIAHKLTIAVVNTSGEIPTDIISCAVVPYSDVNSNVGMNRYTYQSAMTFLPWGKQQIFNFASASNTRKNEMTIYYKVRDLYGVPKQALMIEDNYLGNLTTPPLNSTGIEVHLTTDKFSSGEAPYVNGNLLIQMELKTWFEFCDLDNAGS